MATPNSAKWDFLLAPINGEKGVLLDLTTATDRKLTVSLNNSSNCSFSMSGFSNEVGQVRELATDVIVIRNGRKLFRGRVGSSSDNIDSSGHEVAFSVWSYREMLRRRYLMGSEKMAWYGVDQEQVGWDLIDETQAKDNGSLGITRKANQTTGVRRDISYDVGTNVGDAVQSLSELVNGFEWDINAEMEYEVFYPLRGDQESKFVLDYGGSVASVSRDVDPSKFANVIRLQGGTPELPEPPTFINRFPSVDGGYFSQGDTYRYQVSAILPEGETKPSDEVRVTMGYNWAVNQPDNRSNLSWTPVPRATGYNIYGRNLNDGPGNVEVTLFSTTGGIIPQGASLKYGITFIGPNGESEQTETTFKVPDTGTNTNQVKVTWYPKPTAQTYIVHGRRQESTPGYIASFAPQGGNVPIQEYVDNGTINPTGPAPEQGFKVQRIATNVQETSWVDTGLSAPSGFVSDGQGAVLSAIRGSGDMYSAGVGRIEDNISDQSLLRQPTVDERADWLLDQKQTLRPSYTITLAPGRWDGPDDLWIGDRPTLDIVSGRLDINTRDLRVTEMTFDLDDSGNETVTVTLGYRPANIFEKVIHTQTRINEISRY